MMGKAKLLRPVGKEGSSASLPGRAPTRHCRRSPTGCCRAPTRRFRRAPAWRCRWAQSGQSGPAPGWRRSGVDDGRERGSGTVLAAGLALVVITAMAVMLLLAQSAVLASRAAAAADLSALAAADALRGISSGEPCTVAADVAARHAATVISCTEGAGQTIEVRTELGERSLLGAATGRARAGPPP
ncbi:MULTISPECIES: Rv3654c family TadE-like protein [Micrococcaceae]|uniref:Rv3654c family TadE-like protein n=1 Tax=Arthrobacter sedimenti TaxID=2694931 RepID=A0ABV8WGV3_9MICC